MNTKHLFPALLAALGSAVAFAQSEPVPTTEMWNKLRTSFFAGKPIDENASAIVELDAPIRAEDAAVVPISIRTKITQTPERYIRKLHLVVDKNPSPIGASFTLTPDSGRADIETRIRIEEYTPVRVVAEMNDGKLYVAQKYVKAAGGCSAPAGKDLAEAKARMGKMRLRTEGDVELGKPVLAQLMVSHPNISGLAMDQVTRMYAPAHFVRTVKVAYAGKEVLSADVDFTISENPNFRFYFTPQKEGELVAKIVDSEELTFETSMGVRSGASKTAAN